MTRETFAPIPTTLTLSALVLAQTAAAETPATHEEVQVYGVRDEKLSSPKETKPLLDTPQSVTVIPASVIQEQGASTLVEVFKNSPGISMQAGEGGSGGAPGDSLSIRGFNARKDIFVDGVRDFGSYSRDPFNLEQVEIIKGPSSAFGGRGSTGGAVNLVTKQAKINSFYNGTISGGTDAYQRLTLDVNQSLEDGTDGGGLKGAALRVNAVGFSADTPGRDHVTNQRMGIAPNITFGLDSPTQVSAGFFYMRQNNLPDFGLPFVPLTNNAVAGVAGYGNQVAPVPYTNFYGLVTRDREKISTGIGELTIKHDFGSGLVLSNHTQYGSTDRDSIISAPRFINTTTTNINHELQALWEKDTDVTNQTDLTLKLVSGAVKQTVVTGAEFSHETSLTRARGAYNPGTSPATAAPLASAAFPTTDLFHPDAYQPYPYSVLYTGAYTDTTANSQAAYAFDTLDFGDQWSVTGGLRWDRFQADATAVTSTFTHNVLTAFSRTDNMLSWRASVSFKPIEDGDIYFSSGTSFNPSAEALTLANAANSANSANLSPEKSISLELGSKWAFFKENLLVSAALFRTDKTNARTEDPANPNDFITLNGEQRVQGLELGATGKLTDAWSLQAGYAYMNGKIVSSANPLEVGQPLSSTPDHSASLWTTYDFPFHLEIGGGATYVGARVVNTTATRRVAGYVSFDADAAYHINGHLTVQLNVHNMTDKAYVLDMYNTGSSGHVIPGPGRSAILSLELGF